jgi:Glycosyl transferase family 2
MLFSVVIPTYNRLPLLKEALESVWRQTFADYEVIVIDDGSTDGTVHFARSLGASIELLEQANRGPGAARNLAVQHAKGDYVAFLDSDDVWFPWTLATYASAIDQYDRPSLVSGNWVTLGEDPPKADAEEAEIQSTAFANLLVACTGTVPPVGGTPSIAVRTESFLKVGGFCELLINGEDTDLWLRLGVEPGFVRIHSPPVFAQRIHASNITLALDRAIGGVEYQIQQEKAGAYPGAKTHRSERIRIVAASVRNTSLECLRSGHSRQACVLYLKTFFWQLSLIRFRYLAAFPLLAIGAFFQSRNASTPAAPLVTKQAK